MTINAKADMMFRAKVGEETYGWTESHYIRNASDLPGALAILRDDLAPKRAKLLGAGCALTDLRVSDPDVTRDSLVAEGPPLAYVVQRETGSDDLEVVAITADAVLSGFVLHDSAVFSAAPDQTSRYNIFTDMPYNGFLLRMEGPFPYTARRSLILRGTPDLIQNTVSDRMVFGNNGAATTWKTKFDQYVAELKIAGKYGFRAKTGPTSTNLKTIQDIVVLNSGLFSIQMNSVAGLAQGQVIKIQGSILRDVDGNSVRSLNRQWTIREVNDTTNVVQVYGGQLIGSGVPYKTFKPGALYIVDTEYVGYSNVVLRRWAERMTGAGADQPKTRKPSSRLDYLGVA